MTPPRAPDPRCCLAAACFSFLGELFGLVALLVVAAFARGRFGRFGLGTTLGTWRALGRVGRLEVGLGGAGGHPGLDRLDLGDVARHPYLGVVLGVRLTPTLARDAGAFLLSSASRGAALRLALCASFRHLPAARPSASLFVRGVMPAPAAELPAARHDPANCAGTYWSGSCGACSLRKPRSPAMRTSPRAIFPLDPCLKVVVTKKRPGREARGCTKDSERQSALAPAYTGGRTPAPGRRGRGPEGPRPLLDEATS